jgi:hypothetical protein
MNNLLTILIHRRRQVATTLTIVSILLVGFYFRTLVGLNWDEDQHLHPDERFLTMVTDEIKVPDSASTYFNSTKSPLSPYNHPNSGFFVYGTLPIFVTKFIASITNLDGYGRVHLLGRVISSIFDLLSILTVALLGSRLFGRTTGLVAAALFALVPQNLQLSHFYNVENAAGFFVLLSMLLATALLLPRTALPAWSKKVWLLLGGGLLAAVAGLVFAELPLYAAILLVGLFSVIAAALLLHSSLPPLVRCCLLGITTGCACACKVSATYAIPFIGLPFAFALVRATIIPSSTRRVSNRAGGHTPPPYASFLELFGGGVLVLVLAAVTFRVWQPYAFAGSSFFSIKFAERFLSNMREIRGLMAGGDIPPGVYWVNQPPFIFHWSNMIWWQMGLGWFLAAWLGLLAVGWHSLKRLSVSSLPWLCWTLFWFTFSACGYAKAGRYLSLIYPFFAIAGAFLIVEVSRLIRRHLIVDGLSKVHATGVAAVPAALLLLSALLWAVAITNIYRRPHTRIAASRWIYQNIPCGTTIATEHWDDGLPLRVDGKDGYGGCYKGVELENYHWDDSKKLNSLLDKIRAADYITISSNRLYGSIPRMPRRFPFTSEYYRMLFSGELGFSLEKIFSSYPTLGPLTFNDDAREELILNYDHPKVLIFKKSSNFSFEYVATKLRAFAPAVAITPLDQQR